MKLLKLKSDAIRCLSTVSNTINPQVFLSRSTSPYFNLGLEDWLFRNTDPEKPLLLIYRNEPCAVIGRNQNPWTEVNHPLLREKNIPLIRRRSGGGAVYHDLGNTNYSVHTPRLGFDRAKSGSVPVRALRSLQIPASINERHDVVVNGFKICRAPRLVVHMLTILFIYVSGSAYKIVNKRAYHHGTMLLDCDLKSLGGSLRPASTNIVTKGVSSVRSPVDNLSHMAPNGINHDSFSEAIIETFRKVYAMSESVVIQISPENHQDTRPILAAEARIYIEEQERDLKTWEWVYGQTPEFTHTLNHSFSWGYVEANIHSKHGVILSVKYTIPGSSSSQEEMVLKDLRYGFIPSSDNVAESLEGRRKELFEWIRRETNL